MRALWIILLVGGIVIAVLLLILIYLPEMLVGGGSAQQRPASRTTLAIGPYVSVIDLFENPPVVGRSLNISVAPRAAVQLTGQLIALPQAGTNGTPLRAVLSPDPGHANTLTGSLLLPVRGGWRLTVELAGPLGRGTASLDVTAVVPFVLPAWLGWLLGLSPLVGCTWLIWHQWRYRRQLLTSGGSASSADLLV